MPHPYDGWVGTRKGLNYSQRTAVRIIGRRCGPEHGAEMRTSIQ